MPTPRKPNPLPLTGLTESEMAFVRQLADAAKARKAKPVQLAAFLNGLVVDGSISKPGVRSALAPFMLLPKPEPRRDIRTRMASVIAEAVSGFGCVTRQNLEDAGFTAREISEHFTGARRAARVAEMAF